MEKKYPIDDFVKTLPDAAPFTPNLRHLIAFIEVAKFRSISQATNNIHLSQPAISQAIANLEKQISTKLFERNNKGMFLTDAGRLFYDRCLRAIEHLTTCLAALPQQNQIPRINMITTTQLKALIAVSNFGNFSMAAQAMNIAQPTVHRAARDLERVVNVPLFEKTSFGIRPTKDAKKLARGAKLAFNELGQASAEIHALLGVQAGSTIIGTMPLARTFIVPKAITLFTSEHKNHIVKILEGQYEHLLEGVRSGEIDILIGALRKSLPIDDVKQNHLLDDPLTIIVRAEHPLTKVGKLTNKHLHDYPWVAPRYGTPLRKHFDELFTQKGIPTPPQFVECNSLIAARALLIEGDYLMLLSSRQIKYEKQTGLLVELEHPIKNVSRRIGVTTRRNWRPTHAQQRLLDLICEEAVQS